MMTLFSSAYHEGLRHHRLSVMQCLMKQGSQAAAGNSSWDPWPQV